MGKTITCTPWGCWDGLAHVKCLEHYKYVCSHYYLLLLVKEWMVEVSIYKHKICSICPRHSDMPSRVGEKREVAARALGTACHIRLESAYFKADPTEQSWWHLCARHDPCGCWMVENLRSGGERAGGQGSKWWGRRKWEGPPGPQDTGFLINQY